MPSCWRGPSWPCTPRDGPSGSGRSTPCTLLAAVVSLYAPVVGEGVTYRWWRALFLPFSPNPCSHRHRPCVRIRHTLPPLPTHTSSRAYQGISQLLGSDPTWGFSGILAKAFDCAPIDITGREELLLDPPMQQRWVGAGWWRGRGKMGKRRMLISGKGRRRMDRFDRGAAYQPISRLLPLAQCFQHSFLRLRASPLW
jgi:hypothetical protein